MQTPDALTPRLNPKTRIASIQACRGLAAIAVVLAHLHNLELKYLHSNVLGWAQFGVGGVDLFFVISGVVISAVTMHRFGGLEAAGRFLYQRFARIYPIYWVYSAIVLVAYLVDPELINSSSGHHVDILQSFLLIPTGVPMLLLQGWTLTFEVYFYVLFFLLLAFCPKRWALRVLLMWGLAALIVHFSLHPGQPLLAVIFNPLLGEFLLGCFLYAVYQRTSLHPAWGMTLIATSLAMIAAVVTWTTLAHQADQSWIENAPLLRMLLYGVAAAIFLLGCMELERSKIITIAAPLVAVGDWSYSLYLSHTIVLKGVCSLVMYCFPRLTYSIGWITLLSLPATLFVAYLSFTYLELPLMALLSRPSPSRLPKTIHA